NSSLCAPSGATCILIRGLPLVSDINSIGNNHSQLAIFFHDVDPLDIYFLKLLLSTLQRESGGDKRHATKRGDDGVHLQEPHFFFQFGFHWVYLHSVSRMSLRGFHTFGEALRVTPAK